MGKISLRTIFCITYLLFLSISLVQSTMTQEELKDLFQDWIRVNERKYADDAQKARRFQIFKATVAYLQSQGDNTLGLTKFADYDARELAAIKGYLRRRAQQSQPQNNNRRLTVNKYSANNYPTTFDWRDYGVVSAVKDQGLCANCWAFSTTAFFESQMVRRQMSNNQVNLAQQFFLQCDEKSQGCNGGYLDTAMDLGLRSGIPFQAQFPWNAYGRYPGICSASFVARLINSARKTFLTNLSIDQLKQLLLQRPLNIAVTAKDWQNYAPGTQRTYKCPPSYSNYDSLDHTVLLVGWTETQWIIKNQWGNNWGRDGYIYLSMSDSEDCGIGWEVHTLDFKLPTVDLTVKSSSTTTNTTNTTSSSTSNLANINPTNIRTEIPVASSCPLSNCQTCYYHSPSCSVCKDGYQLNSITKYCEKAKIPNCIQYSYWAGLYQCLSCKTGFELKSGSCATPGFNPPPIEANKVTIIDPFANIPLSFYTRSTSCTLNFCQVCYDNGNQCHICMPGYSINQQNGVCQKQPVQNCNLFVDSKGTKICLQCKRGYKAQGYFSCVSTTPAATTTTSNTSSNTASN